MKTGNWGKGFASKPDTAGMESEGSSESRSPLWRWQLLEILVSAVVMVTIIYFYRCLSMQWARVFLKDLIAQLPCGLHPVGLPCRWRVSQAAEPRFIVSIPIVLIAVSYPYRQFIKRVFPKCRLLPVTGYEIWLVLVLLPLGFYIYRSWDVLVFLMSSDFAGFPLGSDSFR